MTRPVRHIFFAANRNFFQAGTTVPLHP